MLVLSSKYCLYIMLFNTNHDPLTLILLWFLTVDLGIIYVLNCGFVGWVRNWSCSSLGSKEHWCHHCSTLTCLTVWSNIVPVQWSSGHLGSTLHYV